MHTNKFFSKTGTTLCCWFNTRDSLFLLILQVLAIVTVVVYISKHFSVVIVVLLVRSSGLLKIIDWLDCLIDFGTTLSIFNKLYFIFDRFDQIISFFRSTRCKINCCTNFWHPDNFCSEFDNTRPFANPLINFQDFTENSFNVRPNRIGLARLIPRLQLVGNKIGHFVSAPSLFHISLSGCRCKKIVNYWIGIIIIGTNGHAIFDRICGAHVEAF